MSDEEIITQVFFTDLCPNCDNAVMICDGETEECQFCEYSRTWDGKPGSWDPGWHVAGLA